MKQITHELIFEYHYTFYNELKYQIRMYIISDGIYPGYEVLNNFIHRSLCIPLYTII